MLFSLSDNPECSARWVLLSHEGVQYPHFDLMIEDEGVLLTWRLEVNPFRQGIRNPAAQRSFDHPLRFLSFEGKLSGGNGYCRRLASGTIGTFKREPNGVEVELRDYDGAEISLLLPPVQQEQ